MAWSFSFELLPGEEIIEDSTKRTREVIKPAYTVFLTNKRIIFRFEGMGSYLSNAFFLADVLEAGQIKRLFINYLILKTRRKEYLFNIPETEYWIRRLYEEKERHAVAVSEMREPDSLNPEKNKRMLLDMLTVLHKNRVLSEQEFDEKVHLLDTIK